MSPTTAAHITEITTGLGLVSSDLLTAFRSRPRQLLNVPDDVWRQLASTFHNGEHQVLFERAFRNGRYFRESIDGLSGREPLTVEWKGVHRVPGDDAIPADLRVDRVYLISCKYLSRVLVNAGPPRLFDRGLRGDERSALDWFLETAPDEYQRFYRSVVQHHGLPGLPDRVADITRVHRSVLREALRQRRLPDECVEPWRAVCRMVAARSATRWSASLRDRRASLELLWRMLRVSGATYFVLGATPTSSLRLRVGSKWDWLQEFQLAGLSIEARDAGQPEVAWTADVRRRSDNASALVRGHVEVRWSHGRFSGLPEAKVYLDTPYVDTPGYFVMASGAHLDEH